MILTVQWDQVLKSHQLRVKIKIRLETWIRLKKCQDRTYRKSFQIHRFILVIPAQNRWQQQLCLPKQLRNKKTTDLNFKCRWKNSSKIKTFPVYRRPWTAPVEKLYRINHHNNTRKRGPSRWARRNGIRMTSCLTHKSRSTRKWSPKTCIFAREQ